MPAAARARCRRVGRLRPRRPDRPRAFERFLCDDVFAALPLSLRKMDNMTGPVGQSGRAKGLHSGPDRRMELPIKVRRIAWASWSGRLTDTDGSDGWLFVLSAALYEAFCDSSSVFLPPTGAFNVSSLETRNRGPKQTAAFDECHLPNWASFDLRRGETSCQVYSLVDPR